MMGPYWHKALQFFTNSSATETDFQLNVCAGMNAGHVVLGAYDYLLKGLQALSVVPTSTNHIASVSMPSINWPA
jgi:hypothetical protein